LAIVLGSIEFNECVRKLTDRYIIDKLEEAKYKMRRDTIQGDHISKRLFPKKYKDKYRINNLWRYPINSYRLLYTIIAEHNEKKYALLNILTHKEYDGLFGYDTS
jgi:mRNA-degrading endonuclease RelE of RelBE toxin-antitoxin system